MNWELIIELIKSLAWPITLIFLALLLRDELKAIIGRVESAKLPGGATLSFGQTSVDQPLVKETVQNEVEKETIDWSKVATIYWLGHDLMWSIDAILRNAPKYTIIHGLRQSLHHLRELGVTDTRYESLLKKLYDKAINSLDSDWTITFRESYAIELRRLSDQIGTIVASHQPGFLPDPVESEK